MFLQTEGVSLEGFFSANRIRRVAIYGCGAIGELFYTEVKKYGVDVTFAVDRSKDWFYDLPVVRPKQLADIADTVDCVVVCIPYTSETELEICGFLDGLAIPSVYLYEIITACFYKEILLPLCEKKGLRTYILDMPAAKSLRNLNNAEKVISILPFSGAMCQNKPPYFDELYAGVDEYDSAYIENVFTFPLSVPYRGAPVLSDMRTPYVNIAGGMRLNPFIPDDFQRTVHIFGHCVAYGYGVDDARTVAGRLQKRLNEENAFIGIRVLNRGQIGLDMNNLMSLSNAVKNLRCEQGDILVTIAEWLIKGHRMRGVKERMLNDPRGEVYNCPLEYFNTERKAFAYMDDGHLSPHGMELTADYIYEILRRDNILSDGRMALTAKANGGGYCSSEDAARPRSDVASLRNISKDDAALADYLQKLRELKAPHGQSAGAIVMNCNPFTKGHRHLIERAAREVGRLYIFVVQEDKSEFPFETRMEMVKAGTSDIENAVCLPSGQYVLSAMTFPEYFSKDANRDVTVDCSADITIFADKIAPCLGITKRFVGNEPFDPVTRQYNGAMKDILPAHGIEVVEYERFETDGVAVSASAVRKLLAVGRLDEVRNFVPDTTYCLIVR
jgi:[citrate (pro-3S)-lyase] ligase